jgi:hypothetical protein
MGALHQISEMRLGSASRTAPASRAKVSRASALMPLWSVVCCLSGWPPAITGCGGRTSEERPPQDAAPGADTTNAGHPTPASDAVVEDASIDGAGEDRDASEAADAMDLSPIASPPPSDDMRLVGFGNENVGGTPNGWDFCNRGGLTLCPYSCDGAAPGSRGPTYVRYSGSSGPSCLLSCPDAQSCPFCTDGQVYAWFTPPLAANTRIGLWFDLIRLSAILSDPTLTIYVTESCLARETLGTWRMTAVLTQLQVWKTTCVNITPSASAGELGFRFAGSGDIGMDALRFGPACPQ